jgi:hypothetical protein
MRRPLLSIPQWRAAFEEVHLSAVPFLFASLPSALVLETAAVSPKRHLETERRRTCLYRLVGDAMSELNVGDLPMTYDVTVYDPYDKVLSKVCSELPMKSFL